MIFSHPSYFYLLFLILPMLAVDSYVYRKTFLSAPMFINNRKLSNRAFLKAIILATLMQLAFIFTVFATAGPSWGKRYTQEEKQYVDVVLAVDISRSMLADDVYPTRLDHAASMVRSLLVEDPGIRYSLAVIKGGAFELVPMTSDRDAIRLACESLSPRLTTSVGTDLSGSLKALLLSFPENMQTEKVIVLMSDGVDGIDGRRAVCDLLKERKITVHSVSIGTESEKPLKDENGNPVLFRGRPVSVPVETDDMRVLAAETGGGFFQSSGGPVVSQLRQILTEYSGELSGNSYAVHNRDDSGWFAFAALICLCCRYLVRMFLWRKDI